MRSRDWITDVGIGIVGLAAAILTFTTLRSLAEACGITGWLAWLVPVTVDAAGIIAARVWLRGEADRTAVEFARTLAWVCIAESILGNAGQHYMAAFHVASPWWVVVLVSAVPPATLGAVVHLGHLRTGGEPALDDEELAEAEDAAGVPVVAESSARPCHVYRLLDAEDALLYVGVGWSVSERLRKHRTKKEWWSEVAAVHVATYPRRSDALAVEHTAIANEKPRYNRLPGGFYDAGLISDLGVSPLRLRQGPPAGWSPADPIAEEGPTPVNAMVGPPRRTPATGEATPAAEDDMTLVKRLTVWADDEGSMPSRERVRVEFGIGSKRAERLRTLALTDSLTTERREA